MRSRPPANGYRKWVQYDNFIQLKFSYPTPHGAVRLCTAALTDGTRKDGSMYSDHRMDVRIDEEAAEWLVNLQDAEYWRRNPPLGDSLVRWLAQSRQHSDALFHMARIWCRLDVMADGRCTYSQYPKGPSSVRL